MTLSAGSRLGPYEILSPLGAGGMGEVYRARDTRLDRTVAIKVLASHLSASPEVRQRFEREAKTISQLSHPHICALHDVGREGDTEYLVMEYLEGETLADRLARGPVTLADALDVIEQCASALGAAHGKSVLHRDLKPDNLFLVFDPARPGQVRVKIVDFGIAKLQNDMSEVSHRTRTGALVGTPLYMSPEQCLGVRDVGPASDLYALAVIGYEMLCGRPPFEAEAVGALINMHVNEPVLSPRKLNPRLPRALESLLIRALSKAPDNRPTMEVLLEELRSVRALVERSGPELAGSMPDRRPSQPLEAVTAVPPSTLTGSARARTGPVSRPPAWGRMLGSAAVAGTIVTLLFMFERRARPPEKRVVPPPAAVPAPIAAPLPVSAPTPVPPDTMAIELDSDPPGATVTLDGQVVGKTPASFTSGPRAEPMQLVFSLDGYRTQSIHALPAAGLKVRARLQRIERHRGRKPRVVAPPADDIKQER
jgi:eukaryotic-like serine/threonine-protein kinase